MMPEDPRRYRIMLVDDDPGLLRLLTIRLKSTGYDVAACESATQAQLAVPRFRPDVVVTDLRMAEQDGIGLLKDLQRQYPALPVILMTAHGTIPDAVTATQGGAFAFLTKPIDRDELLEKLEKALKVSGFANSRTGWWQGIVTRNALMEERLAEAQMAAGSRHSVLITGQPGTGKRLLAHAIHRASQGAEASLDSLDCASLDTATLQARVTRLGPEGAVLLQDVSACAPAIQELLIRLAGAQGTSPLRILSTTSHDLRSLTARGQFREDLLYRLSTHRIDLPPLSQRRDDIPLLAAHILDHSSQGTGQRRVLAPEALELLVSSDFPGNVRQLFAVIMQAATLSSAAVVSAESVQRALGTGKARIPAFDEARDEFARNYLEQLLQMTRGNVTQAARLAGRNRTDFYKLLGRHRLSADAFKP